MFVAEVIIGETFTGPEKDYKRPPK